MFKAVPSLRILVGAKSSKHFFVGLRQSSFIDAEACKLRLKNGVVIRVSLVVNDVD